MHVDSSRVYIPVIFAEQSILFRSACVAAWKSAITARRAVKSFSLSWSIYVEATLFRCILFFCLRMFEAQLRALCFSETALNCILT